MTIALITDGMLCYRNIVSDPAAPDGAEGLLNMAPVPPCAPGATDPALTPPDTPGGTVAAGPSVPSVPCATTATDPTITPPAVPVGQEASENLGSEAPAVPKCPKGEES
jgi:hypothetical protein